MPLKSRSHRLIRQSKQWLCAYLTSLLIACGGDSSAIPNTSNNNSASQTLSMQPEENPTNSSDLDTMGETLLSDQGSMDTGDENRNLGDGNAASVGDCDVPTQMQELLRSVNAARAQGRQCGQRNLSAAAPLTWNCPLGIAADGHSADMAQRGFISHEGSNGSTLRQRVAAAGFEGRTLGENVAAGYSSVNDVMSSWLSSPGHCSNIMNSSFTGFGAAVAFNRASPYQYYWTQVFGHATP